LKLVTIDRWHASDHKIGLAENDHHELDDLMDPAIERVNELGTTSQKEYR